MAANVIESFFVALGFEIDTEELGRFEQKLKEARDTVLKVGAVATAAAGAIGLFVTEVASGIDETAKMASRIGLSVEAMQELSYAASEFNVQNDALIDGIKELSLRADEFATTGKGSAEEAFGRLGLSRAQIERTKSDTEGLFDLVLERMRTIEDVSARQRIADEIFGGTGGEQMVDLVTASADEFARLRAEAAAFGVATAEDAAKARELTGALNRTKFILGALGKYIAVGFMPQVTAVLHGFRELLLAHEKIIKSSLGNALKVVTAIIGSMWDWVQRLANLGMRLVTWFIDMSGAAKVAASALGLLGAAMFWPAALIGALVAGVILLIDELVNFYEGNETIIGQLVDRFPAAIWGVRAAVLAIGTAIASFASFAVAKVGLVVASLIRMGAAWLVAMGPIGWVVAAVVVAAGLIWTYWDELSSFVSSAWETAMQAIQDAMAAAADWVLEKFLALGKSITGFVDDVKGAIGSVGEFLGLTDGEVKVQVSRTAQAVAQSPAMQLAAGATAPSPLAAPGGVMGRASNSVTNTSSVTQTTSITAPITINSPDPAKAGEAVRQELERMNKQAVRNGQTAVAL